MDGRASGHGRPGALTGIIRAGALAALLGTGSAVMAPLSAAIAQEEAPLPEVSEGGAPVGCRWSAPFELLYHAMPDVVGECLEDERADDGGEVIEQRTSGGVLRRDGAGEIVTFSDGTTTWIVGPDGLPEPR